ncbi:MAG: 3-isopropylmalate dehydratase large subunit [Candidatus Sumerlaeota bacterium]|nr:3-isopropylmalate dehydratase large subunit [Candidatus Sumerlaeota bacterium]
MGMTITEKILARHAGRDRVAPGENIWISVDVLMTHDICGPGTIDIFKEQFGANARVWDREKIVLIPDHYIFTQDASARRNLEILREFAAEQNLKYFYDAGTPSYKGVCHAGLPEAGHTRPGEVLFGTDSHTCTHGAFGLFASGIGNTDAALIMGAGKLWVKVPETMRLRFDGALPPYVMAKDLILHIIGKIGVDGATYRAMEFCGEAIAALNIEERMTLCNMAIEAGGKSGLIACDDKTEAYVRARTDKPFERIANDADAAFHSELIVKTAGLEPTVAAPHSPENAKRARDLKDIKITQAYVGSCTGGKTYDFVRAAEILKGRRVAVKTCIVPATRVVEAALASEKIGGVSLRKIFEDAGCQIAPPSCAACLGGPPDTFGRIKPGDVCISATNRNFPGRMGGGKDAQVYLASPLTVAASAIRGVITDPREFMA